MAIDQLRPIRQAIVAMMCCELATWLAIDAYELCELYVKFRFHQDESACRALETVPTAMIDLLVHTFDAAASGIIRFYAVSDDYVDNLSSDRRREFATAGSDSAWNAVANSIDAWIGFERVQLAQQPSR